MEEKLKHLFVSINDNLRFAEAKNTGLVALNGAVLLGSLSILKDFIGKCPSVWQWILVGYLLLITITSIFSIFISLSSVAASLREKPLDSSVKAGTENLLYFGYIINLTPKEFLEKFKKKYGFENHTENEAYLLDLATQIIIVSTITARKYFLFNNALSWAFVGITTPIGFFVYYLFYRPSRKKKNDENANTPIQNTTQANTNP